MTDAATTPAIDPLLIDLYPRDAPVDWATFVAAGAPWCGAIFKAAEGTRHRYDAWLKAQRRALREAAGDRYAHDLFIGMYHYLTLDEDGSRQADAVMAAVNATGGEDRGTLWLMVDVERGGQSVRNPSRALVEDRVRTFAARYHAITGRAATLYGGELLRAVGVRDRLGCERSALALYGEQLRGRNGGTADLLRATGTDLDHLMLWQYRGTEPQNRGPRGYPLTVPGAPADVDISALVWAGGLARVRRELAA